jgi:hypothetical protein
MQQVVKKFNGCDKHRTSVDTKETLEKTEKTIKNGQSRETGNAEHTKCRKTKQKHNTIYAGHHYAQTSTNNSINESLSCFL